LVREPANWVTASNPDGALIPPNLGPGQFGWSGVLRGAAVVFFAYIGFDAVSTANANDRKRQKGADDDLLACEVVGTDLVWCIRHNLLAGEDTGLYELADLVMAHIKLCGRIPHPASPHH
jgi:hypothetical protein